MRIRVTFVVGTIFLLITFQAIGMAQDPQSGHGQPEPPMAGIHWVKGHVQNQAGTSSPNLLFHGGPVMSSVTTVPIFWGPSWGNANFTGDKMSGLVSFYSGMGNTAYAATSSEYLGVGNTITNSVSVLDLSSAPNNGNRTAPILAEVCKVIASPVANGYYPVYVDTPRGHAGFCAWHSAGSCGGTPVQFAFFFNLDGDAGCDPQSNVSGHSQGLAALANVSGHELSEARTDPRLNAWYDSQGQENADKCAWSFGSPFVTFFDGTKWKVQGNWSNAAYNADTGYPNLNGQKGCIDGH